jgi:GNAT superfamily N-acetyltransferase
MHRPVSLHPFARALRRRLHEDGALGAARYAAKRLRAQLYEHERHLVVEKDLSEIAVPVRRGTVRLEPVERRHLPTLREINREREDRTGDVRFAGDLDDGYAGFVGFKGDEPIGCYWWVDASMPPHREFRGVALGVELGPGDVYGTDFYVAERHRAGGTAADFLYQLETALRERGFERLWGTVDVDNRSARWTYAARGYRERWAVVGTRILRRWRSRVETIEGEGAVPQ